MSSRDGNCGDDDGLPLFVIFCNLGARIVLNSFHINHHPLWRHSDLLNLLTYQKEIPVRRAFCVCTPESVFPSPPLSLHRPHVTIVPGSVVKPQFLHKSYSNGLKLNASELLARALAMPATKRHQSIEVVLGVFGSEALRVELQWVVFPVLGVEMDGVDTDSDCKQ